MNPHVGAQQQVILFLSSDPTDAYRLRLGQEMRDIEAILRAARMRECFVFETRTSVRPTDLTQAIFDTRPTVVHFSGHGTEDGELCFESADGKVQPISQDALVDLFKLLRKDVQCVVLNACFSEHQALAIAKHIPYVIGMRKAIGSSAAIAFAAGFYKALAGGRSIRESFDFGIVELKLVGIPEAATPVMLEGPRNTELVESPISRVGTPYKHFVYISKTKVNMMYSQISMNLISKLAEAAGIDQQFLLDERNTKDEERTLLNRLAVVNEYIESEVGVGTSSAPKQFVKDTVPMKWGPYAKWDLETGELVYFGGIAGDTVIGLGGSSCHVIGNVGKSHTHSHSATPAILRVLVKELKQDGKFRFKEWGSNYRRDDDEMCYAGVQLATSQMFGPSEPIEFVAKTLKHWRGVPASWLDPPYDESTCNVLLATPIYAATL